MGDHVRSCHRAHRRDRRVAAAVRAVPAIAVEAPGATAPNAIADTRGQALRLLAIFFLTLLPWFAAVMGVVILLGPGVGTAGSAPAMVALVIGGIAQTAVVSLSAVIAAHAFMFLAAHLKHAAH